MDSGDQGERPVKQVIVIRRDLRMRRGKEIAQGAHAAMAFLTSRITFGQTGPSGVQLPGVGLLVLGEAARAWVTGGFRKVTCQVPDEAALLAVRAAAHAAGLEAHLITDQGLTEFDGVPTNTAVAVGPDYDDLVDKVTGHLALY